MVEYRGVPEDDIGAFRSVLDYAFRASAGPTPDRDEDDPPSLGDRRGLYEDDRLVTTAVHHTFTVAVRDRWHEVAGLGAVATRPEDRRRGLVRRLLAESLAEYRERGQPFALLWPFKHPFYGRFGWGRVADLGRYEVAPGSLSTLAEHPLAAGRFDRLSVDDIPALSALDDRFADRYDLTTRRSDAWYRHRFFEGWQDDPFVYGWFRDDELGGYLRYGVEEVGDDERLDVWEFGAPDEAAVVNLLRFLHRHEDQVDRLRVYAPVDDLVFDLVEDPGAVEVAVRPGPMGRLVDVAAGLEALPAPSGADGSVTLSVTDPLADWNDRPFAVEARAGSLTVEAADGDAADAVVPVQTLSRLAFGSTTVERAAIAGGLEATDEATAWLETAFPPRRTFLREFF